VPVCGRSAAFSRPGRERIDGDEDGRPLRRPWPAIRATPHFGRQYQQVSRSEDFRREPPFSEFHSESSPSHQQEVYRGKTEPASVDRFSLLRDPNDLESGATEDRSDVSGRSLANFLGISVERVIDPRLRRHGPLGSEPFARLVSSHQVFPPCGPVCNRGCAGLRVSVSAQAHASDRRRREERVRVGPQSGGPTLGPERSRRERHASRAICTASCQ